MNKNIGFVGLGKLGLPVAVCIDYKGYNVLGYDINPICNEKNRPIDLFHTNETDIDGTGSLQEKIIKSNLKLTNNLENVIIHSDIIFVAVQTPHHKLYEGITRIPDTRIDFDYTYLVQSIKAISSIVDKLNKSIIISIISTVLPTTINTYIKPILSNNIKLCYNPYFIAMGTTARDFLYPEFILLGFNDESCKNEMIEFYDKITDSKVFCTTIENAELIKVTYNTMISTKILFINNVMELCDKLPNTNVDVVSEAISLSNRRLISNMYLKGGMGDGGGCHPRDNIALSWLSNNLNLSINLYDMIMTGREKQTEFLANLIVEKYKKTNLNIIILGKSFKAETNLIEGSPSILLKNILDEKGINAIMYDPFIDKDLEKDIFLKESNIYFIGTKHKIFSTYKFPKGSIVIDPHRYIKKQEGVNIHQIGIGNK